jgi:hypothetical protein
VHSFGCEYNDGVADGIDFDDVVEGLEEVGGKEITWSELRESVWLVEPVEVVALFGGVVVLDDVVCERCCLVDEDRFVAYGKLEELCGWEDGFERSILWNKIDERSEVAVRAFVV